MLGRNARRMGRGKKLIVPRAPVFSLQRSRFPLSSLTGVYQKEPLRRREFELSLFGRDRYFGGDRYFRGGRGDRYFRDLIEKQKKCRGDVTVGET